MLKMYEVGDGADVGVVMQGCEVGIMPKSCGSCCCAMLSLFPKMSLT